MNVLSLFDGMSCGQIALHELGIEVENYYASEVDRHAIAQTKLNFPDTVHLGDVRNVSARALPPIDLLIGGSPCTDFSFAGRRRGMATVANEQVTTLDRYMELKRDGFEFVGQSYLFWEYVRILRECREKNPGVLFLLENVEMGRDRERVIDEAVGVEGVHINSALVSAQNRRRIYWTNIRTRSVGLFGDLVADIPQPADRGIVLRDILEPEVPERYFLSQRAVERMMEYNRRNELLGNGFRAEPALPSVKADCLTVGGRRSKDLVMQLNRSTESGGKQPYQQDRVYDTAGQPPALMAGAGGRTINIVDTVCVASKGRDAVNKSVARRVRNIKPLAGKTNTLLASSCKSTAANGMTLINWPPIGRIRRLTPTECARLQTIPDWYRWECSEAQQYRMLGNGWTVEVIKHIFSFIDMDKTLKRKHLNTE